MGRVSGRGNTSLHSPWILGIATAISLILFWTLWQPIPVHVSDSLRIGLLIAGSLLYFSGLALAVWGRIALGEMHNVSTMRGAELFEGQRLITTGPFAYVRNPMYVGAFILGLGGLLLYRTWAAALISASFLIFIRRAHQEEIALAAEFGDEWIDYCRRVPAWIPRGSQGKARLRTG
jgi:protein-S-isoprenylcysteine O-methyltransferase Ste14